MKAREYRELSRKELIKVKEKLKRDLLKAKTRMGMELMKNKSLHGGSSGSGICKKFRKEIARINTVLNEREDET